MRVLALTKYGQLAASTRQRFTQYSPWLDAAGLTLTISPLLDNDYLRRLFRGKTIARLHVLAQYAGRFGALFGARRYDVLWVHYEMFPYLPGLFERLVRLTGRPVVYDLDDAIFHNYDLHRSRLVRALLGHKLEPLVRAATTAVCGNAYLQKWARQFCSDAIVVPTVVDIEHYCPAAKRSDRLPTIGWIGSPSTFAYVEHHLPLLRRLVDEGRAAVTIVGSGVTAGNVCGVNFVDWTEATEIAAIQSMDIGIMPLPDTPWARGKCGYKLIQYMACGLPVVASPVGVNQQIVDHGANGFLAVTDIEWSVALEALVANPAQRTAFGAAGRNRVVRGYSIQRYGPVVAEKLLAAARSRRLHSFRAN